MAKLVDDILLKVHRFCAPHPRRALEKAAFKGQRILYVCTSDAVLFVPKCGNGVCNFLAWCTRTQSISCPIMVRTFPSNANPDSKSPSIFSIGSLIIIGAQRRGKKFVIYVVTEYQM